MPTTADDIRSASELRTVFGRLRPGFYEHETQRFEGPAIASSRNQARSSAASKGKTRLFKFSEDGTRILIAALINENR